MLKQNLYKSIITLQVAKFHAAQKLDPFLAFLPCGVTLPLIFTLSVLMSVSSLLLPCWSMLARITQLWSVTTTSIVQLLLTTLWRSGSQKFFFFFQSAKSKLIFSCSLSYNPHLSLPHTPTCLYTISLLENLSHIATCTWVLLFLRITTTRTRSIFEIAWQQVEILHDSFK